MRASPDPIAQGRLADEVGGLRSRQLEIALECCKATDRQGLADVAHTVGVLRSE